jgi:hypothetical protein
MSVFVSEVGGGSQIVGRLQALAGLFLRLLPRHPSHLPKELRGLPDRLLLDVGIDPRTLADRRDEKTVGPHTPKGARDPRSRTAALP